MNTENSKLIGAFYTKSTTTKGDLCKTICHVKDNGVIEINQVILSDEKSINGFESLYTKFGKTLFVKAIGFKYSTLNAILDAATKSLDENRIDPKHVL